MEEIPFSLLKRTGIRSSNVWRHDRQSRHRPEPASSQLVLTESEEIARGQMEPLQSYEATMRKFLLSAVPLALLSVGAFSQPKGWNDPFPPFRIMDNLYYVGTKELASFLFVTPQGDILVNTGYESSVPVIKGSVEKLGFKFTDIKILIAGHAHPDHVGGDNMLKELTGAQVVVGRLDAGKTRDFHPAGQEHPIDRLVDEGDTVSLGGTTLTAHVMPGHTRGCLAWSTTLQENGKSYYTFVECSLNGR